MLWTDVIIILTIKELTLNYHPITTSGLGNIVNSNLTAIARTHKY